MSSKKTEDGRQKTEEARNSQGVKGLMGCYCHLFKDWAECDRFHKQKFIIGQRVAHRCTGLVGVVAEIREQGFYIIKYGERPCDHHLKHAANLQAVDHYQHELELI